MAVAEFRRTGRPLPKTVLEAPRLLDHLHLYWNGFLDLDTCRPMAFEGTARIPWTAVIAYAREEEFDPEQTERLIHFLGKMDSALIEHGKAARNGGK